LGKRIKGSCLSIIIFIVTLEMSARIDDKIRYDAPIFSNYSAALLRSRDSEGINYNIPNAHFEKWRINEQGFRGSEISLKKESERIRIVCLGTSETFGLYESPGKEWANQLLKIWKQKKNSKLSMLRSSACR